MIPTMTYAKQLFIALVAVLCSLNATAQGVPTDIGGWAERAATFGSKLPQEQVFVHLDNTGYYIGDTIYYKAYVTLSNAGAPSALSGLLYCELLNNDGYLVERQKIRLTAGQGRGSFVLTDSLYGGYYELRAYTRWQLNWGVTEHPHTARTQKWFYSKPMRQEFFRDYDKLYSRVFPVYDKPRQPGNYSQSMTLRPLQRYFKTKPEKPEASLAFFPEGGCLVEGAKCRVAFEANSTDGQHLKGKLTVRNGQDETVAEAETESRGRGSFLLDVAPGQQYKAEFTWKDGTSAASLPKAEADGVAIRLEDEASAQLSAQGSAAQTELGYTIMCQGVVKASGVLGKGSSHQIDIPRKDLPNGVAQLTVFDVQGRVWADRLFFVRAKDFASETVDITGYDEDGYEAFQKVQLGVKGTPGAIVSVAVRDAVHQDNTFDSGNILTEMLLSSQIKGFVEQPEYFFEQDDDEHRRALDLLLLVQGWRRYDWHTMTSPGAFALNEPYEKTEWIVGEVLRTETEESVEQRWFAGARDSSERELAFGAWYEMEKGRKSSVPPPTPQQIAQLRDAYIEDHQPAQPLKQEMTVYADFMLSRKVEDGHGEAGASGEMKTSGHGQFRFEAPAFDGYCYFNSSASDHTKWKAGTPHTWIEGAEIKSDANGDGGIINYPEFYMRFKLPYPRFVKPYTFYQTATSELPLRRQGKLTKVDDVTLMREVTIGATHSGSKQFDPSHPAFIVDAYEAFNNTVDAGFCAGYYMGAVHFATNMVHAYFGDMNDEYNIDIIPRFNSKNLSHNFSDGELAKYSHLHFLDNVYVYTDYAPRLEGDHRYQRSDKPEIIVDLRKRNDGTQFATYRDRHRVLWGYSVCSDFYHPDYSQRPTDPNDYRRTLYWNPDLQLDGNGQAEVTFYNNNSHTTLAVDVEGIAPNGTLQVGTR